MISRRFYKNFTNRKGTFLAIGIPCCNFAWPFDNELIKISILSASCVYKEKIHFIYVNPDPDSRCSCGHYSVLFAFCLNCKKKRLQHNRIQGLWYCDLDWFAHLLSPHKQCSLSYLLYLVEYYNGKDATLTNTNSYFEKVYQFSIYSQTYTQIKFISRMIFSEILSFR